MVVKARQDATISNGSSNDMKVALPRAPDSFVPEIISTLLGHFDGIDSGGWAAGWAHYQSDGGKVDLEVLIDDEKSGVIQADQFREDLFRNGWDDPNCAFWFCLPESALDGREHEIDMRFAATGERMPGSPRSFSVDGPSVVEPRDAFNILPNAEFQDWPGGLAIQPTDRFTEVVRGWYYDFRGHTPPPVRFSAAKPVDVALPAEGFALRVAVTEDGGPFRLIVPFEGTADDIAERRLSIGIRRSVGSGPDAIHIAELFVGALHGRNLQRLRTLRRNIHPNGTQRISNISIGVDAESIGDGVMAIVIEIMGEGEMLLFSPELRPPGGKPMVASETLGEFEDPGIRSQIAHLKLSAIWSRAGPVTALAGDAPVLPAMGIRDRASVGVPFIQIVVPVFNATIDVEELLRSILASTDSPFEVVLLDDASAKFSEVRAAGWCMMDPRIQYVRHRENVGYTANVNQGLQSAVSEFATLLNSDTIVTPGWLTKLYEVMAGDPMLAAVGPLSNAASWQSVPRTKTPSGKWVVNAFPDELPPDRINAMIESMSDGSAPLFPLLNGFCTLFRKSALEAVGYFDDAAFPRGYGEENDLCIRLGQAGYKLRVATNTYVHHKKSRSFGPAQRDELAQKANAILRAKHPEVDFGLLEEEMQGNPAINAIRRQLSEMIGVERSNTA